MQVPRSRIHHALDVAEGFAAAPFHHVGRHGPGTSGEADERDPAGQFAAHQRHGVDDVFEFLPRIRHGELGDIRGAAHRPLELGAFAGLEFQSQVHGMRDGENIREQDGGVERVPIHGLQRDLAGNVGSCAHGEEAACALAGRPVLGKIAAGLTHQPDRAARRRFAHQRAQQQVVLQGRAHDGTVTYVRPGRTIGDAREWHSDRSCPRCSLPPRGRALPVPAPIPTASPWPRVRRASARGR